MSVRALFAKRKGWRSDTLANPLLYANFVRMLTELNGDYFDTSIIDTSLTWSENLTVAEAHHYITKAPNEDY